MYKILGVFIVILFVIANVHYSKRQTYLFKQPVSGEKLFIMAASLAVFLVIALQSEYSNHDLLSYANYFTRYSSYSLKFFLSRIGEMKDPIYHMVGSIFAKIGFSFRQWYLLIGFVYALSVYQLISRYSSNVYISFIVLITIGNLGFTLSGLRQALALAFFMFSFGFLENKKLVKFVFMILIAALFHSSALIFIFAYPLYRMQLRPRNLVILGMGALVVILNARFFLAGFIRIIGTEEIYGDYLEKESALTVSGIIISAFILIFCLVSYYLGGEDAKYRGLCNLAAVALTFRILSVTMFAEMFRISMYFAVFNVILIAEACSCGSRNVFLQRVKTVGASLAMMAYYFVSPSSALVNYIFK